MMTLKYPEPAIHEHSGGALFTLSPQGEPGVLPATHQHLVRLRAMLRQRLTGPVKMTCHPHRVGLSSSVAIYLEGKLKQAVNILITVTGQQAMMDEYKSVVNSGDTDAVRADEAGRKVTGTSGNNWIGGQKRGGAGQPAIRVTHDLVAAGYNMMNGLPVTSDSTVGESSCNGGACSKFGSAEEAAAMTVKVLGDRSMRTCANASECTSGDADDQPGTTVAGTGFAPLLEEATKANAEQLVRLVNGTEKPTAANLAKLKTGGLPVTAGVIKALQRDPDNAALTARLAGELAMSDTVETALLMRRMMITGMSEPNAAAQPKAIDTAGQRIEALDREIAALKNEMEMKRELSRNSVLTIIDRENQRVETNPQTQSDDNTDSRFNQMAAPQSAE